MCIHNKNCKIIQVYQLNKGCQLQNSIVPIILKVRIQKIVSKIWKKNVRTSHAHNQYDLQNFSQSNWQEKEILKKIHWQEDCKLNYWFLDDVTTIYSITQKYY